jgi:hypothetical protein
MLAAMVTPCQRLSKLIDGGSKIDRQVLVAGEIFNFPVNVFGKSSTNCPGIFIGCNFCLRDFAIDLHPLLALFLYRTGWLE